MAERKPLVLIGGQVQELPAGDTTPDGQVTTILDADYNSVSLLLHGDALVDYSPTPTAVSAFGNAAVSGAQSKYGGSSFAFDGTGDYLTVPSSTAFDFAGGDFTLEAWLYPNVLAANREIIGKRANGSSYGPVVAYLTAANAPAFLCSNNGAGWPVNFGGSALANSTWSHVAWVRYGNLFSIYVNGVLSGSATVAVTLQTTAQAVSIGASGDGTLPFSGYLDDVRITKGVARYTAGFTPPVAALPDAYSVTTGGPVDVTHASRGRQYANSRAFALP